LSTHGILSVGTVTIVPLSQHDRLGNLVSIFLLDETKDIRQSRVGLFVGVRNTHTTTSGNIVSLNSATGIGDGNESDIVGQDIDRVVGRDSDGDLELSGKVGRTVQWLKVLDSVSGYLLLVEPDLVVGGSTRE
jgi:hypothetical protein